MKRVLIFSLNYYPSYIGGAEIAIKEITDRISPEDIEFHMITLRIDSTLPNIERIANVTVHRIGFSRGSPSISDLKKFPLHLNKYYFQIAAYWKAVQLHAQEPFDTIWAMMAHSCGIPAGLFKKRFPNVNYLLTLQEGDPPEHIERIMKPVGRLFKNAFVRADTLQSISTFLEKWGVRMGFNGNSVVIPNGVDIQKFTRVYSDEDRAHERARLGKKEGDIFLVTTSRLVYKNGIDDVIRALPLLSENISFLIYGIGPDEDTLRALARDLGVAERVRFMGQISHDNIPRTLAACDIFVRPSRSEGMGNSFIEAMAAGIPVIATQEGGIADFLFDERRNPDHAPTGWAVDANAPRQVAEAVNEIVAHPERVRYVISHAREVVRAKYNWEMIAAQVKQLF